MEPIRLDPGRNDLYREMDANTPLERLLIEGRWLQSDGHDPDCPADDHMHWYRKILETYDPNTDTILLSKNGSRRLLANLGEPDKRFTRDELYEEALNESWMVRETDDELF